MHAVPDPIVLDSIKRNRAKVAELTREADRYRTWAHVAALRGYVQHEADEASRQHEQLARVILPVTYDGGSTYLLSEDDGNPFADLIDGMAVADLPDGIVTSWPPSLAGDFVAVDASILDLFVYNGAPVA